MALSFDESLLEAVSLWVFVGGILFSAYVLFRVREDGDSPLARLRSRFVLGVPWGTIAVVVLLWFVYYVIQGAGELGQPVVVGFRSWSYTYPLGMILAPFAHSGKNHLLGNLFSTVAFAPVAEYAWSHYPTRRGSQSFSSLRTNPYARIGAFVVGVFVVGLATSFLIPGALIGFSGVVFAFAGYALVTKPIIGLVAVVAERFIRLVYFALDNPILHARGKPQVRFVEPFFADVAVQGHALGLVLGVLLGLYVTRRRDKWPDVGYVWAAVLLFAVSQTLYAFYWYLGGSEYVLFRGFGMAAVLVLAGIVAIPFARSDGTLVSLIDLSRREAATGLLVAIVLAMAVAAIPYNTVAVAPGEEANTGVEVRDYTVTYAENVPNRYVAAVDIPFVEDALTFNTSGVIVTSERRNAWEVVVPKGRLAVRGKVWIPVGGLGWHETVVVNRTTWSIIGGKDTYKVYIEGPGGPRKQVFYDEPAVVPAVVNNSRIAIAPDQLGYEILVSRNGSIVASRGIPDPGENVTVADITFNRTGKRLWAIYDGTRIPIAEFQLEAKARPLQ